MAAHRRHCTIRSPRAPAADTAGLGSIGDVVAVCQPLLNGFKLLEIIGLEMEIPVVLMSAEGTNSNVLKGVTYGAVDFLPKPIRSEDLQFLWQHALSKLVCEEKQKHKAKKSKKQSELKN